MHIIKISILFLLCFTSSPMFAEVNATSDSNSNAQSSIYIGGNESINNTPSMSAGSNNTVSCAIGNSAAIAVPGFGASVGSGKIDNDCNTREEALVLRNLVGFPAAIEHLCRNDKSLRETLVAQGFCKPITATNTIPNALYTMCELRSDNKIYIRILFGANEKLAIKQCKKSLGY